MEFASIRVPRPGTLRGPNLSLECRHVCVHSMSTSDPATLQVTVVPLRFIQRTVVLWYFFMSERVKKSTIQLFNSFYTDILTRKIVLWYFFMSERVKKSTIQLFKSKYQYRTRDGKITKI